MGDIFADGGVSSYPTDLDTRTEQANATPTLVFDNTTAHASKVNELADAVIAVQTKVATTANSGTSGGIIFANSSGNFAQHTDLEWDNTTGFLQIGSPGSVASAAAGDIILKNTAEIRASNAAGSATLSLLELNASNNLSIGTSVTAIGIGAAASTSYAVSMGGGFTTPASNNALVGFTGTTTGGVGHNFYQAFVGGTLSTATSGTHAIAAYMNFATPTLTINGTAVVTDAAAVRIANAPSGATRNYSLWIDAGLFRYDDPIAMGGGAAPTLGTIGGSGPATAGQNQWIRVDINGTTNFIPVWQ